MRSNKALLEILDQLAEIKEKHPELRFGQILCNALDNIDIDLYYLSDETVLKALINIYNSYK